MRLLIFYKLSKEESSGAKIGWDWLGGLGGLGSG
jgi:hypothetical protein